MYCAIQHRGRPSVCPIIVRFEGKEGNENAERDCERQTLLEGNGWVGEERQGRMGVGSCGDRGGGEMEFHLATVTPTGFGSFPFVYLCV